MHHQLCYTTIKWVSHLDAAKRARRFRVQISTVLMFQVPKLSCVHMNGKGSQQTMMGKSMYT